MVYVTPGGFKWDTVHEKMKLLKCKKYQKPNIKISIEIEQRKMSQPRRLKLKNLLSYYWDLNLFL